MSKRYARAGWRRRLQSGKHHVASILAAIVILGSLAVAPGTGNAEGSQQLGAPSISVAAGTGVVAEGVGLASQPASFSLGVAPDVVVRQVLLYWQGLHFGSPDGSIVINGSNVSGTRVGGPTAFTPGPGEILATSYRADITHLALVTPGGANNLTVSGVDFDVANDGAAVVAIVDDGGPKAEILVRDGVDTAWSGFQDPLLKTTVPQQFTFTPSNLSRTAKLTVNAGDVGADRPNIVRVSSGGVAVGYVNVLGDTDGNSWDTVTLDVTIPASASSLTAEVQPHDDGSGRSPASLALVNMTLALPNPCPASNAPPATADGNAFGVMANIRNGTVDIPARPHTDGANPDYVANLDADGIVTGQLLFVQNESSKTAWEAEDTAEAVTSNLVVNLPGLIVTADTVVARSHSTASGSSASSTSAGSVVEGLSVNGTPYAAGSGTPLVIPVMNGAALVAEVHVLETVGTGAAAGVLQPEAGAPTPRYKSGLAVNGLRIKLYDLPLTSANETSEIIVAHADSAAEAPSLKACNPGPGVAGEAFVLDVDVDVTNIGVGTRLGQVTLPSTGGDEEAYVVDLHPLGAGAGISETEGNTGIPEVRSRARVTDANLLSGQITALLVEARSNHVLGSKALGTGAAIASLKILGIDVCTALGLSSVCEPPPNTTYLILNGGVLVAKAVLNQQLPSATGGVTVNAAHVTVLGPGNPFGLPVGADVIISSATADSHL